MVDTQVAAQKHWDGPKTRSRYIANQCILTCLVPSALVDLCGCVTINKQTPLLSSENNSYENKKITL